MWRRCDHADGGLIRTEPMGEWVTIDRPSSCAMAMMTNEERGEVALRFRNGGCYRYTNVDPLDIHALTSQEISIGRWINKNLKKGTVKVKCLERPKKKRIPRKKKKAIYYKTRVKGHWKQWDE